MTRDDAKKLLPIIQAYVEGKNIQYEVDIDCWEDIENPSFKSFIKYRIKPEPKYRPFETQEECWNEMLKHQPFGWIKQKENEGKIVHIGCIFEVRVRPKVLITLSCDEENITNSSYLFHAYTFVDGAPFGKEE